ncbi:MAG: hypothetical protein KDD66_09200 [Bdellovibrionales bacterium]|nr:hypothetical protein [Bdellovibrionales bacterium]
MKSILRNAIFFVFGAIIAVLLVRQGFFADAADQISASLSPAQSTAESIDSTPAPEVAAPVETAASSSDVLMSASSVAPELRDPKTDPAKRVRILRAALEEGTIDSLELVAEDFVASFPEYQTRIRPALEEQALQSLLSRMTYQDRWAWPQATHSENGSPSEARLYVDDVFSVNPWLGRKLETTAVLLYGLERATAQGQVFNERIFLKSAQASAQELAAKSHRLPLQSAEHLFDPSMLNDPGFITVFERERASAVARHVLRGPGDISANMLLLHSVAPESITPAFERAVTAVVMHLAENADAKERMAILDWELEHDAMTRFVDELPQLRKMLAELYILGTLDAVAREDLDRSVAYIRESLTIKRGLSLQREVLAKLGINERQIMATPLAAEELAPAEVLAEAPQAAAAEPEVKKAEEPRQTSMPESITASIAATKAAVEEAATQNFDPAKDGEISWFFMAVMLLIFIGVPAGIMYAVNRVRVDGTPSAQHDDSFEDLEIDPSWNIGTAAKSAPAPSVEGGFDDDDLFGPIAAVDVRDIAVAAKKSRDDERSSGRAKKRGLRDEIEVENPSKSNGASSAQSSSGGGPKRKAPRTEEHADDSESSQALPRRRGAMPGPRRRAASA